jgi:hypothetical protein
LPLEPKTIQIEKVPETGDAETWVNFNKRLNDLVNQGYSVSCTTDTYILLSKKSVAIRREE